MYYAPFDLVSYTPYQSDMLRGFYYPHNFVRINENVDHGKEPYVANINEMTIQNDAYRTALWTGGNLQVTLMSLEPGEDIGLEVHPNTDQFLRIEQGYGVVQMGNSKTGLTFNQKVADDFAIMIPAGTWHNLINTGTGKLKLYSIYAPPNHPYGTVQTTKAEAMAVEQRFHNY